MTDPAPISGYFGDQSLKRRYRRILRFAAQALVQTWWFELVLPRFGLRGLVGKSRTRRIQTQARKFYELAADLGGLMIKLGQFLSTRLDVLPEEITRELEGLQDEVAAESEAAITLQVESELGMTLSQAFTEFDLNPIAAASLGQAHQAVLRPELAADFGFEKVVVKVLRPGIERIVEVDLAALRKVGGWLSKIKLISRRADAPALVEEFASTSYQEIDYRVEADNLERFAKLFASDDRVVTPEVVWERSSTKVLTLSDVTAIKITDLEALDEVGISPTEVGSELARITFEQIFNHGYFHADPHPGNIFVLPSPSESGRFSLVFIDFGMMGTVDDQLRASLQRFIFAVAARDAKAWIKSVKELGVLLPGADTVVLEAAVSELFERFGGVAINQLAQTDPAELLEFATRFSELVRTLPFQLPENFLLLIRSISLISGVASTLNRDFNIWDSIDPFARTLLSGGANSSLRLLGSELSKQALLALKLPNKIDELLTKLDRGELAIRQPEAEKRLRLLNSSIRRLTQVLMFGTLLFGGILVLDKSQVIANLLFALSGLALLSSFLRMGNR